ARSGALAAAAIFASRRTADAPKSRNAGPHPQGADVACAAGGPSAVVEGKCYPRPTRALTALLQQRPTANSETLAPPACGRTSGRLMLPVLSSMKAFKITILRPTAISSFVTVSYLAKRSCINGRQLSRICQMHANGDNPTNTGMFKRPCCPLAVYAVNRLLPSNIVNGPLR